MRIQKPFGERSPSNTSQGEMAKNIQVLVKQISHSPKAADRNNEAQKILHPTTTFVDKAGNNGYHR